MLNDFEFGNADILFTDVDDTLTTGSQRLPETYFATCRLAAVAALKLGAEPSRYPPRIATTCVN